MDVDTIISEINLLKKSLENLSLQLEDLKTNIDVNIIKRNDMLRDLIIDIIVNKKQDNILIKQKNKKNDDNYIIIDAYQKNIIDYLEKNKIEYNNIYTDKIISYKNSLNDKLSETSSNNVKNCFTWCYSHINEIRCSVLELPNIEEFVQSLYKNNNDIKKHNKNINDLFKYEANELYKRFYNSECKYFQNYCTELKKNIKNI